MSDANENDKESIVEDTEKRKISQEGQDEEEEEERPDFECVPDVIFAPDDNDDDVIICDSDLYKEIYQRDSGEGRSVKSETIFDSSMIPTQSDEGEEGICRPIPRPSFSDMHVGTWEEVSSVEEQPEQELYDCDYIKRHLGIPLVLGLTEITMKRPKDPIHYLGHWLFKWRYNNEQQLKNEQFIKALNIERELHLKKLASEKQIKKSQPILTGEDQIDFQNWPDIDETPVNI